MMKSHASISLSELSWYLWRGIQFLRALQPAYMDTAVILVLQPFHCHSMSLSETSWWGAQESMATKPVNSSSTQKQVHYLNQHFSFPFGKWINLKPKDSILKVKRPNHGPTARQLYTVAWPSWVVQRKCKMKSYKLSLQCPESGETSSN